CEDDISQESKDELETLLSEGEFEHSYTWAASTDLLAAPKDAPQIACTVLVPQDPESLDEFASLHTRKGGEPLTLQGEGAVVTEKIADLMGVGIGDMLVLNEQDDSGNITGVTHDIPIVGIAENYTGHYVYLTADAYRQIWGEDPVYDRLLVDGADEHGNHAQFSSAVRTIDGVNTVAFNKDVVETYREMLSSVNMVVVVLVLAAMALAFIVLYNLTNINIMERQREIATLKVLGFMPREVSAYIFRETMILSAIGALIGLVLGVFMESFVVITAEVEMVMFGREIHPTSFIGAFLLTLVFTVIVMLVMKRRLAKVDMVESLKSVE
ncbi:MAG: ABC transporter permease, partial [Eggerthellaceae bacterium]